jgi:hypothetical protein
MAKRLTDPKTYKGWAYEGCYIFSPYLATDGLAQLKNCTANWKNCSKGVDLIKKRPDQIWTKYSVLWIQFWKNLKVLTGSEIRIQKKSWDSDTESDPDTVEEWKILWKIAAQTLESEKNYVFYWKFFFSDIQGQEHIWKQLEAPFWKNLGQNISLKIWISIRIWKKVCGSESEKNEFGSTTLQICTLNISTTGQLRRCGDEYELE